MNYNDYTAIDNKIFSIVLNVLCNNYLLCNNLLMTLVMFLAPGR